ncbi:glycoprotein Xg isoform X4 [Alexandromys fortis]|uniref:glycoprotein Xg isoform X3 n=1 Tax=Alexandromys fortis TaxID=100897 RepID=UPI002153810E|nr:glycoprotein Xg isoform X3 [Microtus fortis]XP_049989076.1 glycoprotein Xg isoform X4 [Microtus fortis]
MAAAPLLLLALALLLASPRATRVRGDDGGDFDLADALDPDPTPKPGGGLYPKLPADPLPSDPHGGGGVYPPPRPRPQPPRPRPQPSDTNGFGGSGGYGGYSGGHDTHGGGHGPTHHGDDVGGAQGNTVARIVSPIVSVVVVALVGAGVSYFRSGQRRGCLGRSDPETI